MVELAVGLDGAVFDDALDVDDDDDDDDDVDDCVLTLGL